MVSKLAADILEGQLTRPGTFANHSNVVWVSAESCNVLLYPCEAGTLVAKEVVALVAGRLELLRGEKPGQA